MRARALLCRWAVPRQCRPMHDESNKNRRGAATTTSRKANTQRSQRTSIRMIDAAVVFVIIRQIGRLPHKSAAYAPQQLCRSGGERLTWLARSRLDAYDPVRCARPHEQRHPLAALQAQQPHHATCGICTGLSSRVQTIPPILTGIRAPLFTQTVSE